MQHQTVELTVDESGIVIKHPLFQPRQLSWEDVDAVEMDVQFNDIEMGSPESAIPKSIKNAQVEVRNNSEIDKEREKELETEGDATSSLDSFNPESETSREEIIQEIEDEVGVPYSDHEETLQFSKGKSGGKEFEEFLNFLFEKGYLSESDLPWAAPGASKHYVLNTVPQDQNGDPMPGAKEIRDGVYLYTKPPMRQKRNYARSLLKEEVFNK